MWVFCVSGVPAYPGGQVALCPRRLVDRHPSPSGSYPRLPDVRAGDIHCGLGLGINVFEQCSAIIHSSPGFCLSASSAAAWTCVLASLPVRRKVDFPVSACLGVRMSCNWIGSMGWGQANLLICLSLRIPMIQDLGLFCGQP